MERDRTALLILAGFTAAVALVHAFITYKLIYIGILIATHSLGPHEDIVVADTIGLLSSFVLQIMEVAYWVALVGFLAAGTFGVVMIVLHSVTFVGLLKQRLYKLCLTTSAMSWFMFPFGTALGIASYIVLRKPSVRKLFEAGGGPAPG